MSDFEDLMKDKTPHFKDGELPYAEVKEGEFKQVPLTQEEADLMGEATLGLINSALKLKTSNDLVNRLCKDDEYDVAITREFRSDIISVITWATILLENIEQQTAKAGLGMIP